MTAALPPISARVEARTSDVLMRASAFGPDAFGPVDPRLRASVIVPARNEAERLPALISALVAQVGLDGEPLPAGSVEALIVVNNTTDGSADVVRALAPDWVRVVDVALAPHESHVGRARQIAMDAACARLLSIGRDGLICSTDADTRPAPDWIAQTIAEARGVDAVGGRALLCPDERASMSAGARRFSLLEIAYRRAVEDLRALYAPDAHDPTPRHHHHFGASLAVRADAYEAVGGLPARPMHEDIALVHALWTAGRRLRHSSHVRVWTSARADGRAEGGLAHDVIRWTEYARLGTEPLVEPAALAERRCARLALDRERGTPARIHLLDTPPALPGAGQPITDATADLRRRIAAVFDLSAEARLARARRLAVSTFSTPMNRLSSGDGHTEALDRSTPLDLAERVAQGASERADAADRARAFLDADLDALRASGLLTVTLPTDEGGMGLGGSESLHELLTVLRRIGQGSLPLGRLYEGHVNALLLVARDGTDAQRARLFADARAGHLFAVWNTEIPSTGVRIEALRLSGAKTFATGCAVATRPLITALTPEGGTQMIVVRADESPVRFEPQTWQAEGMRATGSGTAHFDGVAVGARDLLGEPDRYYAEPDFSGGAVRFLAVQAGGADALVEAMANHIHRLGRADHPGQQARFGEASAHAETARLWLLGAARLWADTEATDAERVAAVQAARGVVERSCTEIMRLADHAAGARGLGRPGPLERVARDLRLYLRQPDPDGALVASGAFALHNRTHRRGSSL